MRFAVTRENGEVIARFNTLTEARDYALTYWIRADWCGVNVGGVYIKDLMKDGGLTCE